MRLGLGIKIPGSSPRMTFVIQYEDDVCDSVRKWRLWSSLIMTFVIQSIFGGVAGVSPAEGVARNEVRAQGETSPT